MAATLSARMIACRGFRCAAARPLLSTQRQPASAAMGGTARRRGVGGAAFEIASVDFTDRVFLPLISLTLIFTV